MGVFDFIFTKSVDANKAVKVDRKKIDEIAVGIRTAIYTGKGKGFIQLKATTYNLFEKYNLADHLTKWGYTTRVVHMTASFGVHLSITPDLEPQPRSFEPFNVLPTSTELVESFKTGPAAVLALKKRIEKGITSNITVFTEFKLDNDEARIVSRSSTADSDGYESVLAAIESAGYGYLLHLETDKNTLTVYATKRE